MDTNTVALDRFYSLLDTLDENVGGLHLLANCDGTMGWPKRGVYFFFEHGEYRRDGSMRVVRIGTTTGKKGPLWNRLRAHSAKNWVSSFRGDVASALIGAGHFEETDGNYLGPVVQGAASVYVQRVMPLLWVDLDSEPPETGGVDTRRYVEQNAIALLSAVHRITDPASASWLGGFSKSNDIKRSGLWNKEHVNAEGCDSGFLDVLGRAVDKTNVLGSPRRLQKRRAAVG